MPRQSGHPFCGGDKDQTNETKKGENCEKTTRFLDTNDCNWRRDCQCAELRLSRLVIGDFGWADRHPGRARCCPEPVGTSDRYLRRGNEPRRPMDAELCQRWFRRRNV